MEEIRSFELTNKNGLRLVVTNFGGKIISLFVPDKNGVFADVVLGYDHGDHYVHGNPYFGAAIGRFANRIANGKFSLNGKEYQLAINNRNNALHGGPNGFHNVIWKVVSQTDRELKLSYYSQDGEEGFPGNLSVFLNYQLTNDNELVTHYTATTDATTIVNLTHHSFFNFIGAGNSSILDHEIKIDANKFCVVDEHLIPTGELRDVVGTPFDFSESQSIGKRINDDYEQLILGKGYDHNWVLNKKSNELSLAASVYEPTSGRKMQVFTTEPGLQFYSGNFLDGSDVGKEGKRYGFRSAFCLEAQHFPDSPNQPTFPSTVLEPGQQYEQKTIYQFSVR